eukprot:UN05719
MDINDDEYSSDNESSIFDESDGDSDDIYVPLSMREQGYKSLTISPKYLEKIYDKTISKSHQKARNEEVWNFEIDKIENIYRFKNMLNDAIQSILFVPNDIIELIIEFQLNESQIYIEYKTNEIHLQLQRNNYNIDIDIPLNITREIVLYCGGYCWDGALWCINNYNQALHRYSNFDRIAFYCGNQDVIWCKSDEYCYGNRYFVEIAIDSKHDNIWCGIVWNDLLNWNQRYGKY